jgi:anaerobic magnesium-protoporphyrin IX monomethyl ester cyclase
MDLLLTHGYFLYEDAKELQIMKPYPPLGILYICSYLQQKGFEVEVFDSTFSSREQLFKQLQQGPPSVLGIYANLGTRPNVVQILHIAKQTGWQTVVGGPEPAAYIDEYLEAGADIVVVGEGEVTLEELIPVLRSRATDMLERVAGIAFRSPDGRVIKTETRAQIQRIDAQPWPAREAIDMTHYFDAWHKHHEMRSVSLITTRGCPYRCRWCSHMQVFGRTHRRRGPVSVANELEWLVERYHPDIAWMADDVFPIHPGWLFQYAAEIKQRGVRLPFECTSRADRINPQVADALAELGCFRVWIGSESGSQRILNAMERGVTAEQVRTAVALCRSRGIQSGIFLMWGYEGEEISDIESTIEHVKKTDPDVFFTTVAYPMKGTPYFSEVAGRIENLKPWKVGTDRDVRIRGRHSRGFYKFADQLLRSEVELEQLRNKPNQDLSAISQLQTKISDFRTGLYASMSEVEA